MTEKQYGLIIPSKNKNSKVPSPRRKNIFDDDSDDSDVPAWMNKSKSSAKSKAPNSLQQKQATEVINKALKDDPTVYQYDEVYDDIEKKKLESRDVAKSSQKSRYIENLLKASERRKLENEQRVERQVQKERDQEGDEFKDKEEFVTGAYRKKMEETQKMLESERRQDIIDVMTDVTKQKDLSGFYRHLYKESVSKEAKDETKVASPPPKEILGSPVQDDEPHPVQPNSHKNQNYRERSRSPTSNPVHSRSNSADSIEMHKRSRSRDSNHVRHKSRSRSRDSNVGRRRSRSKDRQRSRSRERSRSRDRYRRRHHKDKHRTLRHKHRRSRSKSRDRDRPKRRHDSYRDRSREKRNDEHRSSKKSHRDRDRHREESKKNRDHDSDIRRVKETQTRKSENSRSPSPRAPKLSEEDSKLPSIWDKRTVGSMYDDAVERYLKRKALNSIRPTVVTAN